MVFTLDPVALRSGVSTGLPFHSFGIFFLNFLIYFMSRVFRHNFCSAFKLNHAINLTCIVKLSFNCIIFLKFLDFL